MVRRSELVGMVILAFVLSIAFNLWARSGGSEDPEQDRAEYTRLSAKYGWGECE